MENGKKILSRLSFDDLREKNLQLMRIINASVFPIRYSDKMYQDALSASPFSKLGTE